MSKGSLIFIVFALVLTLGVLNYIKNPKPYKIAWASIVYGNKEHYIECEDLPFYEQVNKAISQHEGLVAAVKSINGVKDFQPEEVKCYTADNSTYFRKGDIVVKESKRGARNIVEKAIGQTFYGIPYRIITE